MCLSVSLLLLGLSPQETSMAPSFADFQSGEVSFSPCQSEARFDYGHALATAVTQLPCHPSLVQVSPQLGD